MFTEILILQVQGDANIFKIDQNKTNNSKLIMKVKFYVLNHDGNVYSCYITNRNDENKCLIGHKSKKEIKEPNIAISKYCFYLFLNEINNCDYYRLSTARFFKSSPYLIKILPTSREFIDKVW